MAEKKSSKKRVYKSKKKINSIKEVEENNEVEVLIDAIIEEDIVEEVKVEEVTPNLPNDDAEERRRRYCACN